MTYELPATPADRTQETKNSETPCRHSDANEGLEKQTERTLLICCLVPLELDSSFSQQQPLVRRDLQSTRRSERRSGTAGSMTSSAWFQPFNYVAPAVPSAATRTTQEREAAIGSGSSTLRCCDADAKCYSAGHLGGAPGRSQSECKPPINNQLRGQSSDC